MLTPCTLSTDADTEMCTHGRPPLFNATPNPAIEGVHSPHFLSQTTPSSRRLSIAKTLFNYTSYIEPNANCVLSSDVFDPISFAITTTAIPDPLDWSCMKCTLMNSFIDAVCTLCQSPRPWSCPKCSLNDDIRDGICTLYEYPKQQYEAQTLCHKHRLNYSDLQIHGYGAVQNVRLTTISRTKSVLCVST